MPHKKKDRLQSRKISVPFHGLLAIFVNFYASRKRTSAATSIAIHRGFSISFDRNVSNIFRNATAKQCDEKTKEEIVFTKCLTK